MLERAGNTNNFWAGEAKWWWLVANVVGLLAGCVATLGCQTSTGSHARVTAAGPHCADFMLAPVSQPPPQINWYSARDTPPVYVEPDGRNNIRLTACESEAGHFYFSRLVARTDTPLGNLQTTYTVGDPQMDYHYTAPLFEASLFGDPTGLDLVGKSSSHGFKLLGHSDLLVTYSNLFHENDQFWDATSNIIIGSLVPGNPFPEQNDDQQTCTANGVAGGDLRDVTLRFGSAILETMICRVDGGMSGSNFYEFKEVIVTDSDPNIPETYRGQRLELTSSDWQSQWDNSHHNVCDSWYIKVPMLDSEYLIVRRTVPGFPVHDDGSVRRGRWARRGSVWQEFPMPPLPAPQGGFCED